MPVIDPPLFRPLYSIPTHRALFLAFGTRGIGFFDFYSILRSGSLGGDPPPDGYVNAFRTSSRIIANMLTNEETRMRFVDATTTLRTFLVRLDGGARDPHMFVQIARLFSSIVRDVAGDRGVYVATKPGDTVGWVSFRLMNEKEQKLDELRRNDPGAYDTVMRSRGMFRELDKRIERDIQGQGLRPIRKEIMGRPVLIGQDDQTGDEFVFDVEGGIYTVSEYITKRKRDIAARKELTRVFPIDLADLRSFGDDEIAAFTVGEVEYATLSDDKAKANALTRIYPTKRTLDGDVLVVAGRYKGFLLNDLVNRAGRMIEGVAYDLDPKSGIPVAMETRNKQGGFSVRANREPYVTVDPNNRLYLRIPSNNAHTALRNAIAELAKIVPSLKYEAGSRKSAFTFEPKDFAVVREALGGMAMSTAATKLLQAFFSQMAKHELALADKNLQFFDADKIGGFQPECKLYHKQKQAMAWLESRNHSGVMALDTGGGKTVIAIASMQKMVRDGSIGESQKFLFVCPPALRGNLPKAITAFIADPQALRDRVETMTYQEFTKAVTLDPVFADKYAAIFFEEAHALKNPQSLTSRAAMICQHPKKILLTASPMEKSPMEVFTLVAVSNSLDLNTADGRAQVRAFRARFCEEVGGKIIGIKNDPVTARDFRVWVKQNLYFADKRDVGEVALPQLHVNSITVTMDPDVEFLYRQSAQEIASVLQGMVAKYRDRNPSATDPAIEPARIKLAKQFRKLFDIVHFPEKFVPGVENPKLTQAVAIIDERVGAGRRSILFTDSPEQARQAAKHLSERFPIQYHAEGAADAIRVWQTGQVVKTYKAQEYVEGDRVWSEKEWKGYVLDRVVSINRNFVSCVLTSTYAHGQNLQAFDTVIHLDRDSWNNETMKQRTARAWRSGQDHSVDEFTIDAVYGNPDADANDVTLDQIASYVQGLEAELFDRVIVESQTEALGKEWFGMKRLRSSFIEINRRMLELALSPYATNAGKLDVQMMSTRA